MSEEARRIQAEYARRASEIPAERYAPTAPENMLARHEVERRAVAALRREGLLPLEGRRMLDVGCGNGGWLAAFERWGAEREALAGLDLVDARAAAAARRLPGADVRAGDATRLPWPDGAFDVVFQSMMMSSVLDSGTRAAIAREMARVLAPGGAVLWYDFFVADPRNRSVRGVGRREIRRLFTGFDAHLSRATLAPPLARVVVPRSWALGSLLTAARVLDTHYVGVLVQRA